MTQSYANQKSQLGNAKLNVPSSKNPPPNGFNEYELTAAFAAGCLVGVVVFLICSQL